MDGKRTDELTAEPGSVEFLRQLLAVAEDSQHPMDKAATRVLERMIAERETEGDRDGT